MEFEWNPEKAALNLEKHDVSFQEASTVFNHTRGDSMKREVENEMEDELLSEYDFAQMEGGVKGKYIERYRAGMNLVLFDSDGA